MKEYMKELIRHLIYKTIGTLSFIRRIEWQSMIEYLDPEEGERILDIACGSGALSLKIAKVDAEVRNLTSYLKFLRPTFILSKLPVNKHFKKEIASLLIFLPISSEKGKAYTTGGRCFLNNL